MSDFSAAALFITGAIGVFLTRVGVANYDNGNKRLAAAFWIAAFIFATPMIFRLLVAAWLA